MRPALPLYVIDTKVMLVLINSKHTSVNGLNAKQYQLQPVCDSLFVPPVLVLETRE
jgi:hypothetical protein